MNRICIPFLFLLITIGAPLQSQDRGSARDTDRIPIGLWGELGGSSASGLSLRADYQFAKIESLATSFRVSSGVTFIPFVSFYAPVSILAVILNGSSHIEVGAGTTIEIYRPNDAPDDTILAKETMFFFGVVGYRYEPPDGGFLFRVYSTTLYIPETGLSTYLLGLGAGVSF